MKHFLYIVIIFTLSCKKEKTISTLNKSKLEIYKTDSIKEKNVEKLRTLNDTASYIKKYFNAFNDKKDSINENLFFKIFPNTFSKFDKLYGFSSKFGEGPLYINSHIVQYDLIRNHINDERYFQRLINLSIYGHWDADNISALQKVLNKNFLENPKMFMHILNKKSKIEIESFWFFFFDGLHPKNKETTKLYNEILNILENKDIVTVKKSYAKVVDKNEGH